MKNVVLPGVVCFLKRLLLCFCILQCGILGVYGCEKRLIWGEMYSNESDMC